MKLAVELKCVYHISRISELFANKIIPMCSTLKHFSMAAGDSRGSRNERPIKRPGLPQVLGEVVFGIHPVRLALQAKRRQPYRLYIKKNTNTAGADEITQLCRQLGVTVTELQKNYLNILAENRPHQGVCLDASKLETDFVSLEEDDFRNYMRLEENKPPIWLLPYTVRDPMNMGSILRSAYFFGVDCVLMPQHNSSPLTPMVSKASAGVAEIMKILTVGSDKTTLKFIKLWAENGGCVIGTSCDTTDTRLTGVENVDVRKPTLLIIGNESEGLPTEILQHCDTNVHIKPHKSHHLDSLNVSVATGIILHTLSNSKQKLVQYPRR